MEDVCKNIDKYNPECNAEISRSWSGKTNKYEYVTGNIVSPSKIYLCFTWKTIWKASKTIKEQGKKQSEVLQLIELTNQH